MSAAHGAISGACAGSAASLLIDPGTQTYVDFQFNTVASVGVRIATDGDVDRRTTGGVYSAQASWLEAIGTASDYEVRCTVVSGTVDGGSVTGSYLALSSSREWYINAEGPPVDVDTAELTIDIRHATRTDDAISFTVDLTATHDTI